MAGKHPGKTYEAMYRSGEEPLGFYDERRDYSDPEMCECGNPRRRTAIGLHKTCERCATLEAYYENGTGFRKKCCINNEGHYIDHKRSHGRKDD